MIRELLRKSTTIIAVCSLLTPSFAWAQPAGPATPPPTAPSATNENDPARLHYDRGIQLFNEENMDAALFEFERAYELAPSYKILYNMARIQGKQNNYAAALTNYRRYLSEGGSNIPDDRRKEVAKEIEKLVPRVATIEITVNVDGADVYLDDSPVCTGVQSGCVGKSPLAGPVTVNPGRRKITAQKAGYSPGTAVQRVVGSDAVSVRVELISLLKTERPVDPAPRNRAIVAWSATGALAIASGVFGVLALSSQSKLKNDRDVPNQDPAVLSKDAKNVKNLALTTDILGGLAVVGGLVSVYLTLKASKSKEPEPDHAKIKFDVGPSGGAIYGTF